MGPTHGDDDAPSSNGLARALLGGSLLVLVSSAWLAYWRYTVDDAFIFYRYAANLATGGGLAYNPSQPVEGFSSPLWLLLLTPFARGDLVAPASKTLGLLAAIAALLIQQRLLSRLVTPVWAALGVAALALDPGFASWAVAGMETPLYLVWQTALLLLAMRASDATSQTSVWALATATALGSLVRPEAALIAAVAWSWLLVTRAAASGRRLGHELVRLGWPLALTAVLAVVPLAFRLWYFGHPLPNTFYAKSVYGIGERGPRAILAGLYYLARMADGAGWLLVATGVAGLVVLWRGGRPAGRLVAWSAVALGGYVCAVGGDVLGGRFFLFLQPLLAIGLAAMLHRVTPPAHARVALLVVLGALGARAAVHAVAPSPTDYVVQNGRGTADTDRLAGLLLRREAGPGDTLLTDNVGAVGYLSGLRILDSYGLTSSEVAQALAAGRERETLLDELFASRPEWVLCQPLPGEGAYGLVVGGRLLEIDRPLRDGGYGAVASWASATGYRRALFRRQS